MGRLEAYRDIERLCQSIVDGIPRYESPQYVKQILSTAQTRITHLQRSPVASSIQDNVEAVKRVADKLREQRDGHQQH